MSKRSLQDAVAYLRVSSAGQVDGHGFARQEDAVQSFAASNGFRILESFRDTHAGTEAERPAFSAMIGAIKSNGIRHVLIERLDRFAREIGVQVALLGMLQKEGIILIEAATGRDVTAAMKDDPMAKALVSIQGVFHQVEKELLVKKLRVAREKVRKVRGRCEGPPPFGLLPGEERALQDLLRLARKRKGKRPSAAAIARAMDELGHVPRRGNTWSRSTIRAILRRVS